MINAYSKHLDILILGQSETFYVSRKMLFVKVGKMTIILLFCILKSFAFLLLFRKVWNRKIRTWYKTI